MIRTKEKNINGRAGSENISYYNEIANSYEAILAEDASNDHIRQMVAQIFCEAVPAGIMLDFGGGTGADLHWLTSHDYNVTFCEPAELMRQKAIELTNNILHNPTIQFLETNKTDFRKWKSEIPFVQKVDAVLANFAVLNCIPDIDLLFENLALVMRPGADFFALVLDGDFRKRLRSNLRESLMSLFNGKPVRLNVRYKDKQHVAYIHSEKALRKNSAPYFSFESTRPLPGNTFILIHLTRK